MIATAPQPPSELAPTQTCPACAGLGVIEATDMFCGAGGSSLGLEHVGCRACGRPLFRVTQCINHWDLALESHNVNFPDADHDLNDIWDVPAKRFRRTPFLWASPACTHHAFCRGEKSSDEEAERSRATMLDVVRFTEHHRYDVVVVENVIEARLWSGFDSWFESMIALGYQGKIVFFNSQFALPTPQSRDRMYVFFWRNGLPEPPLDFRPASWCGTCETVVHGVQTWKKASPRSLRTKPGLFEWGRYGSQYRYCCPSCQTDVAPAVMGAKTIIDYSLPAERIGDRKRGLAPKTRVRIKTGLERLMTTDPVTCQVGGHLYERPGYARVWSVDRPLRTVTTTNYTAVVVPRKDAAVIPNMEHNTGGSLHEPVGAVTGGNRHMLVQVNRGGGKGGRRSQGVEIPMPTVAGHGEHGVVLPPSGIVPMRAHNAARTVDVPVDTVVGGGYHHGLLVYNGTPGFVRDTADCAGTVTSRDKQSLLLPAQEQEREEVTITEADIDDCLFRMLQWPELMRAQQMHQLPDGRPYQLTAERRDKRGNVRGLSNEQRVKMIGNAVSSPVATMLGYAAVEVLR